MTRATAALAATAVVLFALPGAASTQGKKLPKVTFSGNLIYHTEEFAPGVKAFNVTCPAGYVAVSGGIYSQTPGTRQLRSVPGPTAPSWSFGFGHAGTGPGRVTVMVTCVKPRPVLIGKGLFKLKLKTKTVTAAPLKVPGQGVAAVETKCPPGSAPVGGGSDQKSIQLPSPKSRARAALDTSPTMVVVEARIAPVRGGFLFEYFNPTADERAVQPSIRCAPRTQKARRKRKRRKVNVEVVRRIFAATVPARTTSTFVHDCGRGRFPIFAGHMWSSRADLFLWANSIDRRTGARWMIQNGTATPQPMDLPALCLTGSATRQFDR